MAIPFNLPTDEETEENYRRLDQLLLDLYEVLRQILFRTRAIRVAGAAARLVPEPARSAGRLIPEHPPRAAEEEDGVADRHLPDLVPLARRPPVPPPRRRRRRSCDGKDCLQHQPRAVLLQQPAHQEAQQSPSWLNVGIELRQIAEEFRSTQFGGGKEKRRKEIKASSLFSLLVPAPLTGSIWTTVIILVGWRILARHR